MVYNQKAQRETRVACTIYSMLHILKYDYYVSVNIDNILWIVRLMEASGKLMPNGAYFNVIYPAFVKMIELKTGLKFKVKKGYISKGLSKKHSRGLGILKANKIYTEAINDGILTKSEVNKIEKYKYGIGHNHVAVFIPKSKKWRIAESLGGYHYKMDMETLKHAQSIGLYWDTARTIVPDTSHAKTMRIINEVRKRVKKTKRPVSYRLLKKLL